MDQEQAINILKPLMWKVGKSNGEQLWMHQFAVWHIFTQMTTIGAFPKIEKEKKDVLKVACLLHDLKKSTPWNQMILFGETDNDKILTSYRNWWKSKSIRIEGQELSNIKRLFERGRTDHQIETERDLEYFLKPYLKKIKEHLPFRITEERIRAIFDLIKHHFLKEDDISQSELPGFGNYLHILKLCDRMASMETADVSTINELKNINRLGRQIFDVTYFTISRNFGPFTAMVSDILFQSYKKHGWVPLLYLEGGGVLIIKGSGNIPDKEQIIEDLYQSFLTKSIETHHIQYGTKTNLIGMAADHPQKFLYAHKDEIIRKLNDTDAGVAFFKLLTEILDNGGYKKPLERKKLPALDVLFCLTAGTRAIPLALEKWEKYKGEFLPLKEDGSGIDKRSSLNHIFNSVGAKEIIPNLLLKESHLRLRAHSSHELFDILSKLAGLFEKEVKRDSKIKAYFDEIISMEEEKDFQVIAQRRFDEYKNYKQKPADEKIGICEICGCTIAQKPGADFAKGQIQAFSQIKARSDIPRKICPFCAYDNSVMRKGVGNWIPVYVRVSSRIPLEFRKEITDKIKLLKDGIIRIQNIENMEKRWGLLFPPIDIPVGKSDYDVIEYVVTSDREEIVCRLESIDKKGFSPKDQRAKYAPLYHILNLLGFRVSIGSEDQVGLFGERVFTTENEYLKSLAVILLGSTIDKKRRYLFSKDLLEKSPSIAIVYASQENMNKKGQRWLRLNEDSALKLFEHIFKSGIVLYSINGGEYKMENLLKDAAFFAEGIPKFCWYSEDWNKWRQSSSKHLISKPISQTMNEILQGRNFDEAFVRFLSQIRKNIAKEKSEEAKTDVKELEEFVKSAKEKLAQYYDLKKKNITEFIRVKNALLSAVYVFKRYENLKEVIK